MKSLMAVTLLLAGCAAKKPVIHAQADSSLPWGAAPREKSANDEPPQEQKTGLESLDPPVREAVIRNFQERRDSELTLNPVEKAMTESLWLEGFSTATVTPEGRSFHVVPGPRFKVGPRVPKFVAPEIGDDLSVRLQMEKLFPDGSYPSMEKMKQLEVRLRVLRICRAAEVGLGQEDLETQTVPMIAICRVGTGTATVSGAGCPPNPACRKFSVCETDSNGCSICACP